MNPYEILGVSRDAAIDEIRVAYRRERAAHHPDREGGDTKRMADINVAYEILSDPERRANYDKTGQQKVVDLELEALKYAAELLIDVSDTDSKDILYSARIALDMQAAEARGGRETASKALQGYKEKLKRVRRKDSAKASAIDVVTEVLNKRSADAEAHIKKMDDLLDKIQRVRKIFDDYEYAPLASDLAEAMQMVPYHWRKL